jgi:hypothetical protein
MASSSPFSSARPAPAEDTTLRLIAGPSTRMPAYHDRRTRYDAGRAAARDVTFVFQQFRSIHLTA